MTAWCACLRPPPAGRSLAQSAAWRGCAAPPENGLRGSERVGAWPQVTQLDEGKGAGLKESSWGPLHPPCL